jgi:hypothetical protein
MQMLGMQKYGITLDTLGRQKRSEYKTLRMQTLGMLGTQTRNANGTQTIGPPWKSGALSAKRRVKRAESMGALAPVEILTRNARKGSFGNVIKDLQNRFSPWVFRPFDCIM